MVEHAIRRRRGYKLQLVAITDTKTKSKVSGGWQIVSRAGTDTLGLSCARWIYRDAAGKQTQNHSVVYGTRVRDDTHG